MSAGWLALTVLLVAFTACGSFFVGDWRRERFGKAQWADGYYQALLNHYAYDDPAEARAEAVACAEPYAGGDDEWETFDGPEADVRAVPAPARGELGDDGGGEGAPGVLAGGGRAARGEIDVPRPGGDFVVKDTGPGRYDLDHPAPAGFYPELAALADLPRPGQDAERGQVRSITGPGEFALDLGPNGEIPADRYAAAYPDAMPSPLPDPVFGCLDDDGAFALIRWELGRLAWLASEPFTLTPWRVPELAGTPC